MTSKGPFQPKAFYDSMIPPSPAYHCTHRPSSGLRGCREQRSVFIPCDPCSLCVPEVSPVHSHLCFPLAWFPVRLSQPGAEQRQRVTHTSRSELALFSLRVLQILRFQKGLR